MNSNKPSIYIIAVDKDIYKIGHTKYFKQRLYNYAIGFTNHPAIEFIMLVDNQKKVEEYMKFFFINILIDQKLNYIELTLMLLKVLLSIVQMLKEFKKTNKFTHDYFILFLITMLTNIILSRKFLKKLLKKLLRKLLKTSKKYSYKILMFYLLLFFMQISTLSYEIFVYILS